jgi:hypothetical protein
VDTVADQPNAGKNAGKSAAGCVVVLFATSGVIFVVWLAWLIIKAILTAAGNEAGSVVRDIPVIPPGAHDSLGLAYTAYVGALAIVLLVCWETFRERANPALVGVVFVALGIVPAVLLNMHVTASYPGQFSFTDHAACGSLWTPQVFAPPACTAQLDSLFQWIATIAIGAVVVPMAYVGWVTRKGAAKPANPEDSS